MASVLGGVSLVLALLVAVGAVLAAVDVGGALAAYGRACDVVARPVAAVLGLGGPDASAQDRLLARAATAAILLVAGVVLPLLAGRTARREIAA